LKAKPSVFSLLLFLISIFFSRGIYSQSTEIDSLLRVIKTSKEDTNKARALNAVSREFIIGGDFDHATEKAKAALSLSEKLKYKKGISAAYNNMGLVYDYQGKFSEALTFYFTSVKLDQELGDKTGLSKTLNNIGVVFMNQGNYPEALKNYFASLKIKEELGNKKGIAYSYNNIGNVYRSMGNYPDALKNHQASLKIRIEINDQIGISDSYNNIGNLYYTQNNFQEALKNYLLAQKIREETGNTKSSNYANSINNIGLVYLKLKKLGEAEKSFLTAQAVFDALGEKQGLSSTYEHLGSLYMLQKKPSEAKIYFLKALTLSKKIGHKEVIKDSYNGLAKLDSASKNYSGAFENFKQFILYRDSLINEESKTKTLQSAMQYGFDKKTTADSVKNVENQKVTAAQILAQEAQIKQEQITRYGLYGGLILVIAFLGFVLNRFRVSNRQKKIIEVQNKKTEEQKTIIEEKNKDIMDSIRYAKRIQSALLKEEDHVTAHLPSHFILYIPKDIISGDFYWTLEKQDHLYLAAADCTGHGVPGAMMSMLGIAFLNEITSNEKMQSPAVILDLLRDKIIKELKSKDGITKDGMDISLVCLDLKTKEMQWSGANNPLWILKNGNDLIEIKADKQPIGIYSTFEPFTNHKISLSKNDSLYFFTDGFADQFGGPKGKKYKYAKLKELLIEISGKTMNEQKEILNSSFEEWRGDLEQIDDVCVIGMKI